MSRESEKYQLWLKHEQLDEELRDELLVIKDQKDEIADRFYTHLSFGTGGMRGVIGAGTNRMNIYTIRKATLGLAQYLHHLPEENTSKLKSVAIAYDCRHKSILFAEQAALTLAKEGIRAYLFPSLRPTPQLSYTVRKLGADAGIVITASHNPPEYNGYKVYSADGAQLNPTAADQVISYVNQVENELFITIMDKQEALRRHLLIMLSEEMDQHYVDYVTSLALQPQVIREMADKYKIVFTPLHGTAYLPVKKVLHKAGFKHVEMVEEQIMPDPEFSTVSSPNPEEHEAFTLAIQYAKRIQADIIMGTDPDADRMGIVIQNPEGEYQVLTGNQTGALLLNYIITMKKEKGLLTKRDTICKTIVTSDMGREIGQAYGLETIDTLTGFKFIGEKIKEFHEQGNHRFLFGYEESYGYLIGDEVRDKDAIQAVFLVAEMGAYYKSRGMSLFKALEQIYEKYGFFKEDLISITLKGRAGLTKIEAIMQHLRENPPRRLGEQQVVVLEDYLAQSRAELLTNLETKISLPASNVLKYELEDGTWFCIRPSGTEPKLKIYIGVKADSNEAATIKLSQVKQELQKVIDQFM